jgi:hypothetical protein
MNTVIGILCIVAFFLFVEYMKNRKNKKGPIGKLIGKKIFK